MAYLTVPTLATLIRIYYLYQYEDRKGSLLNYVSGMILGAPDWYYDLGNSRIGRFLSHDLSV